MKKVTLLYVDDDLALQTVSSQYLEDSGYVVHVAGSRAEMVSVLGTVQPDVILLDLTLPDADGFEILRQLRPQDKAGVIITSGKTDTTERIIGIELGADDYLTKPFDMREMVARIGAVVRRRSSPGVALTRSAAVEAAVPAEPATKAASAAPVAGQDSQLHFAGGMVLDRNSYQVYGIDGASLNFTSGEFKLLEGLLLARNRVLTREHLFDLTRDGEFLPFDRAIDIQISRIRKKLGDESKEAQLIKTVRGVGYMLVDRTEKKAVV